MRAIDWVCRADGWQTRWAVNQCVHPDWRWPRNRDVGALLVAES